jgi:hypothetical protein
MRARRVLARTSGPLPSQPLALLQALVRDLRAAPQVTLAALTVVAHELRRLAEQVGGT